MIFSSTPAYRFSGMALISIPPIISVNQWTPEISLPKTVMPIMIIQPVHSIRFRIVPKIYLLISKGALPMIIHVSMVCEEGKDASGCVLPGMIMGL